MRIVLLIALAGSISAAPIVNLFNTGQVDSNGVDGNWTVNGTQAFVTDQSRYPFPLWNKSSDASWISPQADYDGRSDASDTTFLFSTTFTLPARFRSASILMRVASDNALQDVTLNGVSVGYPTAMMILFGNSVPTKVIGDGTGFTAGLGPTLSVSAGLQPGLNTLNFFVRNSATTADNVGNPSGLMAAFTSDVIEAPEPASFALIGGGLALLALLSAGRRRILETKTQD